MTSPLPVLDRLDREALLALAPEWDDLVAQSPTPGPFLSWAWVGSWLATLGADADLEAYAARDPADGSLLGVAPFFVEKVRRAGMPYRSLRFIGSGPAAPDHLDLPVRRDRSEVAAALWQVVLANRRWDAVDLDGLAPDGRLAGLLNRRRGDKGTARRTLTPYLPLTGDPDDVAGRFSPSLRRNLGRYSRKLDREAGKPVREWMVASSADLDPTLDRLEAMHQAVRSRNGQRGAFGTPALAAFQREVARHMLQAGRLRLWRLDIGDDTVAAIECFRYAGSVAFYTTGYDLSWARYGPGRRIMARAIFAAAEEGAERFDFLRGDEGYKANWGTVDAYDLRIRRAYTPRARLLLAAEDGVRSLVGRLRSRT